MRVRAATEPADWGEVEVLPYVDDAGHGAFYARFDLDQMSATMAANVGKGLVILAAFFRGKDGAGVFSREFFFRER